jgi:hypothetical protein
MPVGVVWLVGLGGAAITAILIAIAWLLVRPPPAAAPPATTASPLERTLFDRATGGSDVRAAGEARLWRYAWVDRQARVVRIPIDRAIDAVVADPGLLGPAPAAVPGAASPPASPGAGVTSREVGP